MEEIEVPIEGAQEEINHHAMHSQDRWISGVALTSALLAVLAAVTALLAGHHANEAMIEQMTSSDGWAHYQAKSIKASVLGTKMDLLAAMGKPAKEADQEKLKQYAEDQNEISEKAKEKESSSQHHMKAHTIFARGVTMFQVAIGIAAIAVLMRRRKFWFIALAFGILGAAFLAQGLMLQH